MGCVGRYYLMIESGCQNHHSVDSGQIDIRIIVSSSLFQQLQNKLDLRLKALYCEEAMKPPPTELVRTRFSS